MKQYSFILIGAGGRGMTYTREMLKMPEKYKLVAMADPLDYKRERCIKEFGLAAEQCYSDWRDILAKPKMADIAIIATMDDMHYEPAMKAIELGYDLLLEKPVANTEKECIDIANAAKAKGVRVLVCHVLRYTPFYRTVKSIIESGMIGEVVSVDQVEAIGDVHFSHSYVRGNWHSTKTAAPMILAKSCHDLDIIQWLIGKPCKNVSSFGSLKHFKAENAPEGAPKKCIDGTCPVKEECPYNCYRVYVDQEDRVWHGWKDIIKAMYATHPDFTDEEICEVLKKTDFGNCVYYCDNDALDHQVVNMEFCGGATATLTVNAFNAGGRYTRVYGTKGELWAFMSDKEIFVRTLSAREKHFIPVQETEESIAGGHGGGDYGIVRDLYNYLNGEEVEFGASEIGISVENHMMGFAAEESRKENCIVTLEEFCKKHGLEK
ncbi:MAG: Gfo/Idh/MocA family oxidoreductase [Clostridia bacterium]|nr:Gfo/Idh/MocA family oxidoreductase [Clostridia bacterium]